MAGGRQGGGVVDRGGGDGADDLPACGDQYPDVAVPVGQGVGGCARRAAEGGGGGVFMGAFLCLVADQLAVSNRWSCGEGLTARTRSRQARA